jgi:hypothetical protein
LFDGAVAASQPWVIRLNDGSEKDSRLTPVQNAAILFSAASCILPQSGGHAIRVREAKGSLEEFQLVLYHLHQKS